MREQHPYTVKAKRRRILYFEFGLIIALSFCLWAFNTNYEVIELRPWEEVDPTDDWDTLYVQPFRIEEEMPKPKTQEAPKPRPITTEFTVVDNTTPIDEPSNEPTSQVDLTNLYIFDRVDDEDLIKPETTTIIDWASKMPEFKGGEEAMFGYISAHFKYPELARESGIQGRIVISFVVEKDGSLSNIKLEKDPGFGLGAEGLRIVREMPNWIPGENNFRPVRVRMRLPIKAVLD